MRKRLAALLVLLVFMIPVTPVAAPTGSQMGVNVALNTPVTESLLKELGHHGRVLTILEEIDALTMKTTAAELERIRQLPFVKGANPDAERNAAPIVTNSTDSMAGGISTWNLDAVNVTEAGVGRVVDQTGEGVYVAVLDTGLVKDWRRYFPEARIASEFGASFGGGGGERGTVSTQPNKWERDVNSHGTHVTSSILGYQLGATPINGTAPEATIIPVKVLNQNGSGWSSVVAQGITYIGDLKAGPLADHPVIINMSLGGPVLDAVEQEAIDYALEQGVIIVASAGNEGEQGMGYPGAYDPVISVAASGWTGQWETSAWWTADVAEPIEPLDFYIADFSSRALEGQDLDVAAPGSWIVGPYQTNGQESFYYLSGTSMASPHVAGITALMVQKYPELTAAKAEEILQDTAVDLGAGSRAIKDSTGQAIEVTWGEDATGHGLVDAAAALNALDAME